MFARANNTVIKACAITSLVFFLFLWHNVHGAYDPPLSQEHTSTHVEIQKPSTEDRNKEESILRSFGSFSVHHHDEPKTFWSGFSSLLLETAPTCPPPRRLKEEVLTIGYNSSDTETIRPDYVELTESDRNHMKQKHTDFMSGLSKIPHLPFLSNSRGVVTTAGLSQMPTLLISLLMLRETGSKLPVEIVVAGSADRSALLCEEILPRLDARCTLLSDMVPATLQLSKYQYKVISILASSFSQVLFLDADDFPVVSPDNLFDVQPFKDNGLVTWPDFWTPTSSHIFYEITNITTPPLNLRASTESGQILVNKATHANALLNAAYYNYHGPSHYYVLLSQGAPGEGDKETFIAGAQAHGLPFYQVHQPVRALGHRVPKQDSDDTEFKGVGMVQHDPIEDYASHTSDKSPSPSSSSPSSPATSKPPTPLFVHANFPKLDPTAIFTPGHSAVYSNGTGHRLWDGVEDRIAEFGGKDVEKLLWSKVMEVTCELETGLFEGWTMPVRNLLTIEKVIKYPGLCDKARRHWVEVYGGSDEWGVMGRQGAMSIVGAQRR